MEHEPSFLSIANEIGRQIIETAEWDGDKCTWTIRVPDRSRSGLRRTVPQVAGGSIYSGTSGIALFLFELYSQTQDSGLLNVAEGALRHALQWAAALPETNFSFHSGRVGVAHTAVRAAELLGADRYRTAAEACLRPLAGNEASDRGLDVIGGAAGAIPSLLNMARTLDPNLTAQVAARLGDHLISVAEREPVGWSWSVGMVGTHARNLCGLAHGASGVGHALLELYAFSKRERYRYAAEQALLYERQYLSPERLNWPDFRHLELSEYIYGQRIDELREMLGRGDLPPTYQLRYMSAWCHGAPGIALTRLRAYKILGDDIYRKEAEVAIRATIESLDSGRLGNYSLCHGVGGNADILLSAATVLNWPELFDYANESAREGWGRYPNAGRPWPCGIIGAATDPGLMLGEAGIGHWILRLHDPGIPSVLLITPGGAIDSDLPARASEPTPENDTIQLRHEYVNLFFGRTLRIFARMGHDTEDLLELPQSYHIAEPQATYTALRACAEQESDPDRRARLEDALLLDHALFRLTQKITDLTVETLWNLEPPRDPTVDLRNGWIKLGQFCRIVHTTWDWDAWLKEDLPGVEPPAEGPSYLLFRAGNRIHIRRLGAFAALVLSVVQGQPRKLADVVAHVNGFVQESGMDQVFTRVEKQLRQAYLARMVDLVPKARYDVVMREGHAPAARSDQLPG